MKMICGRFRCVRDLNGKIVKAMMDRSESEMRVWTSRKFIIYWREKIFGMR